VVGWESGFDARNPVVVAWQYDDASLVERLATRDRWTYYSSNRLLKRFTQRVSDEEKNVHGAMKGRLPCCA